MRDPNRARPEPRVVLDPDAAIVLGVIDEQWMTFESIYSTLRYRDRRWSPDYVRRRLNEAIQAGVVETGGIPPHYRRSGERVTPLPVGTA